MKKFLFVCAALMTLCGLAHASSQVCVYGSLDTKDCICIMKLSHVQTFSRPGGGEIIDNVNLEDAHVLVRDTYKGWVFIQNQETFANLGWVKQDAVNCKGWD